MNIRVFSVDDQAYGAFNGGEIVENKPIGFPREGGALKPYSNIFYWANAIAKVDSTIGLHPHKGFEIMSFVLEGDIKHFDTQLNSWQELTAGDVQIIRAGNGISHSEFMSEGSRMFQIWLDPNLQKTLQKGASYDDYKESQFPKTLKSDVEITTLIGEGSPLTLDAEGVETMRIKVLQPPYKLKVKENRVLGIYILDGSFDLNSHLAYKDEFVIIENCDEVDFEGKGEIFIFSSPSKLSYRTYYDSMLSA